MQFPNRMSAYDAFDFASRFVIRDFIRAALFLWMTRLAAARSTVDDALRSEAVFFSGSAAASNCLTAVRTRDFTVRLRWLRTRL